MEFMSAREAADKWGISQRRVAVLCSESRIDNAIMVGNMWIIPTTAEKPIDARSIRYVQSNGKKVKPFLKWAGGKGQLLSEIEKYYPFADGKITKYAEPCTSASVIAKRTVVSMSLTCHQRRNRAGVSRSSPRR